MFLDLSDSSLNITCAPQSPSKTGVNADSQILQTSSPNPFGGTFQLARLDYNRDTVNISTSLYPVSTAMDIENALNNLYGVDSVSVSAYVTTPTQRSWTVTFKGQSVGGDVPLLSIRSNLSGVNAYATTQKITSGSEPKGSIDFEYNYSTAFIPVSSPDFKIAEKLSLLLTEMENITVLVSGPYGDGTLKWVIKYYFSAPPITALKVSKGRDFSVQLGSKLLHEVVENGTVPLGGHFNMSMNSTNGNTFNFSSAAFSTRLTKYELYLKLVSLSTSFIGCTVLQHESSIPLGTFIWQVTMDYGSSGFLNVSSRSLTRGGQVDVRLSVPASKAMSGSFNVSFAFPLLALSSLPLSLSDDEVRVSGSDRAVSVRVNSTDSAATVQSALNSLPGISGVIVTRLMTPMNQAVWRVAFSPLEYAISRPSLLMTSSDLDGESAVKRISTVASLPLLRITVQNGSSFDLKIKNISVTTGSNIGRKIFHSNSSAEEVRTALQSVRTLHYVEVQRRSVLDGTEYLIMSYPVLVLHDDNMNYPSTLYLSVIGENATLTRVVQSNIASISNGFGGQFSATLGYPSPLCELSVYKDPICGLTGGIQYSKNTSFPLSASSISDNLLTLSQVHKVSVTSVSMGSGSIGGVFYIDAVQYTVTYLETTKNPSGSAVDGNQGSWIPSTYDVTYSPVRTAVDLSVPLLSIGQSYLPHGWSVTVNETRRGVAVKEHSSAHLAVSLNGQDYSTSSSVFSYVRTVTVLSIFPTHGPLKGGTEVIIRGSNFIRSSSFSCNFGTSRAYKVPLAHFFNSTAVICITPPGDPLHTTASFTVSNSGLLTGPDVSTNTVSFTFDQNLFIRNIVPPQGPTSGNFSVRIFGGPFSENDDLRCKFGEIAVVGVYISNDEFLCYAPPHVPGIYPLEISGNDQDYTTQRKPFYYYKDHFLSRIHPVSGPAFSADTQVQVYGFGFVNSTHLTCRFGYTVSRGIFISSNNIICPSPALDLIGSGGLKDLALSEQFHRFPNPVNGALNSRRRLYEEKLAAEQYATINNGDNYGSSSYSIRNIGGVNSRLFPGSHSYPLYPCRLTSIEVSNNNQDYTDSGIGYLYQKDAYVTTIAPDTGLENEVNTILIRGENFVNSTLLRCRVGNVVSKGTFLSPILMLCFSPVISYMNYDNGQPYRDAILISENTPDRQGVLTTPQGLPPNSVYIEISNNAQDYTNDQNVYTFNVLCRSGYYCPQLSLLPCPRGTYCPGGQNRNFTLCPKGTYNPRPQQSDCARCPLGFMCPEEGMQVPRICPAGRVCEFTG